MWVFAVLGRKSTTRFVVEPTKYVVFIEVSKRYALGILKTFMTGCVIRQCLSFLVLDFPHDAGRGV